MPGPTAADFGWKIISWPLPILRVLTRLKVIFQRWSTFCLAGHSFSEGGWKKKTVCFSRVTHVVYLPIFSPILDEENRWVSSVFICSHFPLQAHNAEMFAGAFSCGVELDSQLSVWLHSSASAFPCLFTALLWNGLSGIFVSPWHAHTPLSGLYGVIQPVCRRCESVQRFLVDVLLSYA